jgi:hypothetical protein
MWTLGVPSVRVTPVVPAGAAARGGRWGVDRKRLRQAVDGFSQRRDQMRISLRAGTATGLATPEEDAPQSLLVRPSGAVRTDSLHPFVFGHALEDGLAECWRRIVAGWRHPQVTEWANSLSSVRELPDAEVVPYLDEDPPVAEQPEGIASSGASAGRGATARRFRRRGRTGAARQRSGAQPVPQPVRPRIPAAQPAGDLPEAVTHVRDLALSRRYRLGSIRCTAGATERYVSPIDGGDVIRLNRSAGVVMDALHRGTASDAVDELAARHPNIEPDRIASDVLALTRSLVARRVVVPARAGVSPRA